MGAGRIPLTLLERQGAFWQVYLTGVSADPAGHMQLDFERTGENGPPLRYTRTLSGPLLTALQDGETLSRSSLNSELEQALGESMPVEPAAGSSRKQPWRPLGED